MGVVGTMKQFIRAFAIVAGFTVVASADTYRWVDDAGVIHFTDNPDRIPSRYLKRVQEIPSPTDSVPKPKAKPPAPPSQRQSQPTTDLVAPLLPGGLSEQVWRSRYTTIRAELKVLRDGLPEKQEALNQLRRKRFIFQRYQDRLAYNQQKDNIEHDEARIKELEGQLSALDVEASRVGVPMEWRK